MNCRRLILSAWMLLTVTLLSAQQYNGTTGLIHVPTADMNEAGDARIGAHFLNKHFTPDAGKNPKEAQVFYHHRKKYGTVSSYLSITPFSWLEVGYTVTLLKRIHYQNANPDDRVFYEGGGFREKDQYFSFKIQPLREKEGKWWPSVAVGGNDFWDANSGVDGKGGAELYFGNWYAAMSKHLDVGGHLIGVHLAYRQYRRYYNEKWEGPVGGVTYNPAFYRPLRFIAEWTGDDYNVGFDCLLWRHLRIQASLQNGKYLTAGACYEINLFGKRKPAKEQE